MQGLYGKYQVTKRCGETDPDAIYIVLRVDKGEYVHACRSGVKAFSRAVRPMNPALADDLDKLLKRFPGGDPHIVPFGWTKPENICPECGNATMYLEAHYTGEGWSLSEVCPECDHFEDYDWPFVVDWVTETDLEAVGFIVV